jgi:hypothetical protein
MLGWVVERSGRAIDRSRWWLPPQATRRNDPNRGVLRGQQIDCFRGDVFDVAGPLLPGRQKIKADVVVSRYSRLPINRPGGGGSRHRLNFRKRSWISVKSPAAALQTHYPIGLDVESGYYGGFERRLAECQGTARNANMSCPYCTPGRASSRPGDQRPPGLRQPALDSGHTRRPEFLRGIARLLDGRWTLPGREIWSWCRRIPS